MRPRKAYIVRSATRRLPYTVRWVETTGDGDRVRRGRSFAKLRDAQSFERQLTERLQKGVKAYVGQIVEQRLQGLGDTPLAVFVHEYMERRRADGIRPATVNMYRDNLRRLLDHFGEGCAIAAISSDDLAKFVSRQRMVTAGREGKPLAKSSRNGIIRDLKTMFNYAKAWGYVTASPMDGVKAVQVYQDDRRGWHYLKPIQFLALLRAAPTLRDKAIYATLYGTGLRFGEAFSLRPDDVDLDAGYVHIRSRDASGTMPSFKVKDHERRRVPLPRYAQRLLAGWMKHREKGTPYLFIGCDRYRRVVKLWKELQARGEQWQDRWLVNNVLRDLKRHIEAAGIVLDAPFTIHAFRKSYGRNGARHLSAEVLKEYMGHSKIETTLTYYSKRDEEDDDQARWVLSALVKAVNSPAPVSMRHQRATGSASQRHQKVG